MSDLSNPKQLNNLSIWDSVAAVDELYTTPFVKPSGWVGTSINPTYLAKQATEKFGPMGHGWGLRVLDEKYVEGAPLSDGLVLAKIHVLRVQLWYMLEGKECHVEQYGQTTFVGEGSFGIFTDEEAPKKSMTDAMTKCLSLLGFAADIYMGVFDNKHSDQPAGDPKKKDGDTATKTPAGKVGAGASVSASASKDLQNVLRMIGIADANRLITCKKTLPQRFQNSQELEQITEAIALREKALA